MKKPSRYFELSARVLLLVLCSSLASWRAGAASAEAPEPVVAATNKPAWRVGPGADDGQIAYWTAQLLSSTHYSQQRFDEEISSQFLDRYLDLLDSQHLHFLQADLDRFERFRTNLSHLTLTADKVADTTPAYEIFDCFYKRLQQRMDYVGELLKNDKFEFNTDERIAVDRRDAPYPRDLEEARTLWRLRLRYEYLQEKLALDEKNSKAATNAVDEKADPPKPLREQIVGKLKHRYDRTARMVTEWNNEDIMGIYLTALARVYDPHSDYFNRAQLESFRISMNLELFGIGAELRADDEDCCKIERLLPGGPALKSEQIQPGDRIVAVAQSNQPPADVVGMPLTKVVQLIRGPKGTEVRLTLMPEKARSERRVVTLIRDQIPLEDQAAKSRIIELPDAKGNKVRLGIIDLPSFYAPIEPEGSKKRRVELASNGAEEAPGHYTSVDVARLLTKFKQENVRGVILDLRGNGGGSLMEAIKLTGLFIKKGPVVQAREQLNDVVQVYTDPDPTELYDGPLIVLTSRFSASASEILAAALQDYGRALVVGDSSTHGKGTVQTVSYLSQLLGLNGADQDKFGALKFTIRKFYRPTGASTQLKGVMPDIVLPSKLNYAKDIGEAALENPLPSDRIPKLNFDRLNLVQPYLSELMRRSSERVATNQDFVYVREDIDEFRKFQADKTVSLNEKRRLQEQAEEEARQKAREKEVRARPEPPEKVYEITLKQAELPGLPPPVQKTNTLKTAARGTRVFSPDTSVQMSNALSLKATHGAEAFGTNTVSLASAVSASRPKLEDADNPDPVPMPDADMNEAKRILLDYIFLMSSDHGVTGEPVPEPAG